MRTLQGAGNRIYETGNGFNIEDPHVRIQGRIDIFRIFIIYL